MLHQRNVTTVINPILSSNFSVESAVDSVFLTYAELKCLEIALYFLGEQLCKAVPHPLFVSLCHYQVLHMYHQLEPLLLKRRLEPAEQQPLQQWVTSAEALEWLVRALEIGMTWETIAAMATDSANYQRDMLKMAAETGEEHWHADVVFERSLYMYHRQYSQFMSHASDLLNKLYDIF